MDMINSPMARLARLFNEVEARLRLAAQENEPISAKELMDDEDLQAIAKDKFQISNVVKTFRDRGHLHKYGVKRHTRYVWDTASEPFVFANAKLERIFKDPSEPIVERFHVDGRPQDNDDHMLPRLKLKTAEDWSPDNAHVVEENAAPQPVASTGTPNRDEIELVVNGVQIVVGTNPATGRLRVSFETK